MPEFVDTTVKEIDDRLRALKAEASRLEAARAALLGAPRKRERAAPVRRARTSARVASRRNGAVRRGGNSRANQTLDLVRQQPGITIPQIAQAMKIQPNYLYRVLPRLASVGDVRRDGQGWHPASSSTATDAAPVRKTASRRRAEAAKSRPKVPARRTTRSRKSAAPSSATTSRTARGATRASVLAALAGGEAMTAGQVAITAGLSRPTVSTTLSKLAKSGEVQKAERGYRLVATPEPSSAE